MWRCVRIPVPFGNDHRFLSGFQVQSCIRASIIMDELLELLDPLVMLHSCPWSVAMAHLPQQATPFPPARLDGWLPSAFTD